VRVGDYIISINGTDLKAPDNIYRPARRHSESSNRARRE
jgi:hypothetical protein